MCAERRRIGRPKKQGEIAEDRVQVWLTPTESRMLDSLRGTKDRSPYIKELLVAKHAGDLVDRKNFDTGEVELDYLTAAPCGPWEEAIAHSGSYTISADDADELQFRDGDVMVRARGDSMEGAGIIDGALVMMRPLGRSVPRRGDIVLVQIKGEHDVCQGTIKRWDGGEPPRLLDGNDDEFPLPDGTTEIKAIATAQGIISRL